METKQTVVEGVEREHAVDNERVQLDQTVVDEAWQGV
jgi:hypothetical protein